MQNLTKTAVRDPARPYGATQRRLHLAMALLVIALALTGLVFYFRKPLGIDDLKLTIMLVHSAIGYGFLIVFATRLHLGFRGADPMRFDHVFPRAQDLKRLFAKDAGRHRWKFAGRSPLSRLIAGTLFVLLTANVTTGMIRAGTDLYFPPFGPFVQTYIAKEGVDPFLLKPGEGAYIEEKRYSKVKRVKAPIGKIHFYGGLLIMAVALLHIFGVVIREWSSPNDPKARGRARLMLFGPKRTP